jgi:hypothetical protein
MAGPVPGVPVESAAELIGDAETFSVGRSGGGHERVMTAPRRMMKENYSPLDKQESPAR